LIAATGRRGGGRARVCGLGNFDLVGNNTPVFRARRNEVPGLHPLPEADADTGLRSNDAMWDSRTLSPESAHQVTILMSDRGIPRTWRHMNGYGSLVLVGQRRRRALLGQVPPQDRTRRGEPQRRRSSGDRRRGRRFSSSRPSRGGRDERSGPVCGPVRRTRRAHRSRLRGPYRSASR